MPDIPARPDKGTRIHLGGDVSGGVVSGRSPTAGILVWVLFAGFWLAFMTLVTVLGWEQIRGETYPTLFIGVFWLVGLFLAVMAVMSIVHARRFGRSTLALDAIPARLGGWLSGVVHGPQAIHGAELQVSVECVRTTHGGSSRSSRSTWTVWRTTKVLDGARCPRRADGTDLPFAVRLPTNEEVSRERNDNVLASVLGASPIDLVGSDMDWYVDVKG